MKKCLFCPNSVDSAEHIWSDWILNDLKMAESIRQTIGRQESVWLASPEIKLECVCKTCNNEWMGRLEDTNTLHMRAMINDDPFGLTPRDQSKMARWAVLKAMVIDSINPERPLFYTQTERDGLKHSAIPPRTLVWLGSLSVKAFHGGGTDIWGDMDKIPKAVHGCVTAIVIGHLVIQVLTLHVPRQFASDPIAINCRDGEWDKFLLDIWPTSQLLRWPPHVTFTLQGATSVGRLVNRFKIGKNVG